MASWFPIDSLSIAGARQVALNGELFHVYKLHLNDRFVAEVRFKELSNFYDALAKRAPDLAKRLPPFPSKLLLSTNISGREKQLDTFFKALGRADQELLKQIKIVHLFLHQQREEYLRSVEKEVRLIVQLPDGTSTELHIKAFERTPQVYKLLAKKLNLSTEGTKCFGLYSVPISTPQATPKIVGRFQCPFLLATGVSLEQISPEFKGFDKATHLISLGRWCFNPAAELSVSRKEVRIARWLASLAKERLRNKSLVLNSSLVNQLAAVENDPVKYVELLLTNEDYSGNSFGFDEVVSSYPVSGTKGRYFLSTNGIEIRWFEGETSVKKVFTLPMLKNWRYDAAESEFSFNSAEGNLSVVFKTPHYEFIEELLHHYVAELRDQIEAKNGPKRVSEDSTGDQEENRKSRSFFLDQSLGRNDSMSTPSKIWTRLTSGLGSYSGASTPSSRSTESLSEVELAWNPNSTL